MIIRKVKWSDDKVHIDYEILTERGILDDYSVHCSQNPRPQFFLALNDLVKHVVTICELPEEYAEGLHCLGVSISYKDEIMGAVISAKKVLAHCDSPLFINTPHMPEKPYGKNAGNKVLPEKTILAIQVLIAEAEEYLAGERAQLTLFAGGMKKVAADIEKEGVEVKLL